MSIPQATVTARRLENHDHVILMTWQHHVEVNDVRTAFGQILYELEKASEPVYVVVDILENPRFPVGTTITEALLGPYRHPNLAAWLILGSNWMAKSIERALSEVTGRKNVFWFDTMDEALSYFAKQTT